MYRTSRSSPLLLALACVMALLGPGRAQAHARLLTATPAAHATVTPPPLIRLVFSEALASAFSSLRLTDRDGHAVALKSVAGDGDSTLQATPAAPLQPGLYTIWWIAVSTDDGHKVSGSFSFTVKAPD
ncbi:MAG TPA: copper resistance protein CopC [Steroidobacteraceae bacterium]|nr:copper resistance protein CopC [Steroidobacteraceae bacterium]